MRARTKIAGGLPRWMLLLGLALATAASGCGDDVVLSGCKSAADCPAADKPCSIAVCQHDGKCATTPLDDLGCDDGQACTVGDRCKAGACVAGPSVCACQASADCAKPDDADKCNGTMFCDKGSFPHQCRVNPTTVVTCKASLDPCKTTACKPETGECESTAAKDGAACNDGDPCSVQSACENGVCKAGKLNFCSCQQDGDCATKFSADKCNGTLYCDKNAFPYRCRLNPASVIQCNDAKDSTCGKNACQTKTGKCEMTPVEQVEVVCPAGGTCHFALRKDGPSTKSLVCDDGNKCTADETCKAGVCSGSKDICLCSKDADCADDDDGDPCNGTMYCELKTGKCKVNPKTVVQCPSVGDTACIKNTCQKKTGKCAMAPADPGTTCDDGDACTSGEVCVLGKCSLGTNTCKCSEDADCTKEDDGDLCNGTLFCNKQSGKCTFNPASVVNCPSAGDTACAKNACQPKTGKCAVMARALSKSVCHTPKDKDGQVTGAAKCGWVAKAAGEPADKSVPCDDGDSCTKGDLCEGKKCAAGTDTCLCKTNTDCEKADDGDKCNGTMYCDAAKKKCLLNPATVVKCPTVGDTFCQKNACQPKTGQCVMAPSNENKLCDDGNKCTTGDLCQSGKCKSGANTCECWVDADCANKEDGNKCNGVLYCDKTGAKPKCKLNPASIVICQKATGSVCSSAACNPATGKCGVAPANKGGSCSDANKCTENDVCKAGVCTGSAKSCDDKNACTNDACQAAKGCVFELANCNDGNACTLDLCDKNTGKCSTDDNKLNGMTCDFDGSGCTINDTCKAGTCVAGPEVVCQVPTKACEQAVCKPEGAKGYKCVPGTMADGSLCDDGDACTVGSACKQGKCSGQGKDRFFAHLYDKTPLPNTVFNAVAANAKGELGLVGGGWKVENDVKTGFQWWIIRTDAAGVVSWQKVHGLAGSHYQIEARAAALTDSGDLWVGGGTWSQDNDLNMGLVKFDPKGKVSWSMQVGEKGPNEVVHDMAIDPNGATILAGTRHGQGKLSIYVVQVAPNGAVAWEQDYGSEFSGQAHAVARRANGEVFVAGQANTKPGAFSGMVSGLSANGKALKVGSVLFGTDIHHFEDMALVDDKTLVLAGWIGKAGNLGNGGGGGGSKHQSWLVATRLDGSVLWQREGALGTRYEGITALGGGRLAVTGQGKPLGGNESLLAAGLDMEGNTHWLRNFSGGTSRIGYGIVDLGDDGLVIAGSQTAGAQTSGLVVRTDPWGHESCAKAGKCLGKKANACADGKVCTADYCAGDKGCQNPTVNQFFCDPKDGCSIDADCSSGACAASANGKLFDKLHLIGEQMTIARVSAIAGGGYLLAGHVQEKDGNDQLIHKAAVVRTNALGEIDFQHTWRLQPVKRVVLQLCGVGLKACKNLGGAFGATTCKAYPKMAVSLCVPGSFLDLPYKDGNTWYVKWADGKQSYQDSRALAAVPTPDGGFITLSARYGGQRLAKHDSTGQVIEWTRHGSSWTEASPSLFKMQIIDLGAQGDGTFNAVLELGQSERWPQAVRFDQTGAIKSLSSAKKPPFAFSNNGSWKLWPGFYVQEWPMYPLKYTQAPLAWTTGELLPSSRAAGLDNGELFIAGTMTAFSYPNFPFDTRRPRAGWLGKLDDKGTWKCLEVFGIQGYASEYHVLDLAVVDKTSVVVAGYERECDGKPNVHVCKTPRAVFARFDGDCKMQWQKKLDDGVTREAMAVTALPGGDVLIGGRAEILTQRRPWLRRMSSWGVLIEDRVLPGTGRVRSLTRLANENLLIAGARQLDVNKKGALQGWLMHASPWAQAGCAAAGVCLGKKPDACDDKNACTGDYCDAKAGCKHVQLVGCK